MFRVQRGIVFRQVWIARIAENVLHEIQVAHEVAGREEPDLHAFLRREPRHFRTNHRTEQQRNKTFHRLRLCGGERQAQDIAAAD